MGEEGLMSQTSLDPAHKHQAHHDINRQRLIEIIKQRSYLEGGPFTLASGRTSAFYINMKPTMMHAEGAYLIGHLLVDALQQLATDGVHVDCIGGLEVGAIPMAAAAGAISFARGQPVGTFFIRKATKDHGTRSLVEGLPKGDTLHGLNVVILEDTTTTGDSPLKAATAARAAGANIVQIITIVDRQEGAAEAIRAAGLVYAPLLTVSDLRGSQMGLGK
jgi:orotate phosphoribosyltransferase